MQEAPIADLKVKSKRRAAQHLESYCAMQQFAKKTAEDFAAEVKAKEEKLEFRQEIESIGRHHKIALFNPDDFKGKGGKKQSINPDKFKVQLDWKWNKQ